MSKDTSSTIESAKESQRPTQKLHDTKNKHIHKRRTSESSVGSGHLLQRTNLPRYHGPLLVKSARQQRSNARKQKTCPQKRRGVSVGRASVPITPQMIRGAVKELETRRVYISSTLIASHLRRRYPIENNPDALKKELNEKLDCAVSVGLIAKCGDDKYCIPTLRQQASSDKTALTSFWETYYKNGSPPNVEQFHDSSIPRIRTNRKKADCSETQL